MDVAKVIMRDDYNGSTIRNDLAILKLNNSLSFNDNVQPVCLPENPRNASWYDTCFTSGWGNTETQHQYLDGFSSNSSKYLKWADQSRISNKKCSKYCVDPGPNEPPCSPIEY